jgi:hypothetical protein
VLAALVFDALGDVVAEAAHRRQAQSHRRSAQAPGVRRFAGFGVGAGVGSGSGGVLDVAFGRPGRPVLVGPAGPFRILDAAVKGGPVTKCRCPRWSPPRWRRCSLFRYFASKEDLMLGKYKILGDARGIPTRPADSASSESARIAATQQVPSFQIRRHFLLTGHPPSPPQ